MLAVLTLWFGISVPLVFLGAYFGYKKDPIEFPVITSNIPRQIPTQPWYLHPVLTCLLGMYVCTTNDCRREVIYEIQSIINEIQSIINSSRDSVCVIQSMRFRLSDHIYEIQSVGLHLFLLKFG